MNQNLKSLFIPTILTILLLFVGELINSTLIPSLGLPDTRIHFHIIVVIYISYKIGGPFVGILIFLLQYFHSLFSLDLWQITTITGISTFILVKLLKNTIHLTSFFMTSMVVFLFQFFWYLMSSYLFYLKFDSFHFVANLKRLVPEALILAIMAPFLFSILDVFWPNNRNSILGR